MNKDQIAPHASEQVYDDMLPVCLHQAKDGVYYLLDRHNDEIATFGRTVELEDMQRIVAGINCCNCHAHASQPEAPL